MTDQLQDESDSYGDSYGDSYATWRMAIDLVVGPFAITMSLVAVFFVCAILKTRKFTFNLYLVFILVPDSMMNAVEGTRCIYEAFNNGSIPFGLCYARNFMVLFYYYSNLTVNAFIAKEVYSLVLNSYRRRRTKPPTMRTVLTQVAIAYSFAALIGVWFVTPVKWSPLTVTNEPHCGTTFGSEWFNGISGILIAMATSMPMLLYVVWCGYQVWQRKLLPLRGRTRALGLYLMRIVTIFIAFYIPMLCIAIAKNATPQQEHDSTRYFVLLSIFSLIIPFQNIVTLNFLMQKDDISETIRGCLLETCVAFSNNNTNHSEWLMDDAYDRTELRVGRVEDSMEHTYRGEAEEGLKIVKEVEDA